MFFPSNQFFLIYKTLLFSFTIVVSAPTTMTSDLLEELGGGGKDVTDSSSAKGKKSKQTVAHLTKLVLKSDKLSYLHLRLRHFQHWHWEKLRKSSH